MCPAWHLDGARVYRCELPAGHAAWRHQAERWDRRGMHYWADPQPAVRQEPATA